MSLKNYFISEHEKARLIIFRFPEKNPKENYLVSFSNLRCPLLIVKHFNRKVVLECILNFSLFDTELIIEMSPISFCFSNSPNWKMSPLM